MWKANLHVSADWKSQQVLKQISVNGCETFRCRVDRP